MHGRIILCAAVAAIVISMVSCGGGDGSSREALPPEQPGAAGGVSLFEAADSAASAVTDVRYTFRVYGVGSLADLPHAVGELSGKMTEGRERPLLSVSLGYDSLQDGSEVDMVLDIRCYGDSVYAYDLRENSLTRGALEDGGEDLLSPVSVVLVNEFFMDDPFSDEMEAESVESLGIVEVNGVECTEWEVHYKTGNVNVWTVGREDLLPRRRRMLFDEVDGEPSAVIVELGDLSVNTGLPDSIFEPEYSPDSVSDYSAYLKVGTPAPSWTLREPGGGTVSLSDLRGDVVVMDFWATWCGPCVQVMPAVQNIYERYGDKGVKVFGVNIWEDGDPVAFMEENGFDYGLLLEGDDVADDYIVSGIPTLYVIDREGKIAFATKGADPEMENILSGVLDGLLEDE